MIFLFAASPASARSVRFPHVSLKQADPHVLRVVDVGAVVDTMKPIPLEELGTSEAEIQAENARLLRELEKRDRERSFWFSLCLPPFVGSRP